jgi:hypothetical protein
MNIYIHTHTHSYIYIIHSYRYVVMLYTVKNAHSIIIGMPCGLRENHWNAKRQKSHHGSELYKGTVDSQCNDTSYLSINNKSLCRYRWIMWDNESGNGCHPYFGCRFNFVQLINGESRNIETIHNFWENVQINVNPKEICNILSLPKVFRSFEGKRVLRVYMNS